MRMLIYFTLNGKFTSLFAEGMDINVKMKEPGASGS
jgi:hypothetical protein